MGFHDLQRSAVYQELVIVFVLEFPGRAEYLMQGKFVSDLERVKYCTTTACRPGKF